LADLKRRFDGIICAFGLPYLSQEEAGAFIGAACKALEPAGVFYLSTMLGLSEDSGFERCSTGDQVYVNYHSEDQVVRALAACGFTILQHCRIPSPGTAAKATTDLIIIARSNTDEGPAKSAA
jgi:predicted TPR repeat methyltransferase